MALSDDWAIDYINKLIEHVDGILPFDGRTAGNAPSEGQYIRGDTSGAVAKILAGGDANGTGATGNLRVTNVTGRFSNNETLTLLSEVPFDTVDNSSGTRAFQVGDTLGGPTTEAITVRAIEFNNTGVAGEGTVYGDSFTSGWANDEQIDNDTTTDTAVGLVNGSEVDNSADTWDGVVNLSAANNDGLVVPGTANTNDSVIIHYDAGTIAIPEDAKIADATTGGEGFAQEVIGVTGTGSIRVVNYDSTGGAFTDNNTLNIEDVVFYNNQVAGEVFSVGDVVVIDPLGDAVTGRILSVIDDGDSTGKLILADYSGGTITATDDIEVGGTKIAEIENTTVVLAAATINLPTGQGIITTQEADQGGLLDTGESLNIVRSFNALYTYLQDTFDELDQMDDQVPMSAQVKDQQYTMINGWVIPDLSLRFLQKGSLTTSDGNNTWTNFQTLGSIADISSDGYLLTTTNPTPQPQIYIEQSDAVIDAFWLNGNIDVNVKVRSNTNPNLVDDAVPGLGVNIDGGKITVHAREYLRTYNVFETTTIGGTAPIPLATADDLNNNTGTRTLNYTGTGGFTIGEEITTTTAAVGIVTAEDTTGNTLDYVLKTGTDFANTNVITGTQSQATCTVSGATSSSVDGYGFTGGATGDIRIMTVNRDFTGGTTSGTFRRGEDISQAGSGATGYLIVDDTDNNTLYVMDDTGTFNGTGAITGQESSATYTPTTTSTSTTFPYDLEDDGTDDNYTGAIAGNARAAGTAQVIENLYEWSKFETRRESTNSLGLGGPGTAAADPDDAREGRIFRLLSQTVNGAFTEVAAGGCPIGTFAGGTFFAAQGWAIFKEDVDSTDVQSMQLIDNGGTTRNPPNLQTLAVTSLVSGDRVAVYRSTGGGSTTILTTEFQIGVESGANNGSGDGQVLVQAGTRTVSPLPSDIPSTGVVRVELTSTPGIFERQPYTSVDRVTNIFTLSGTLSETLTQGDDAFVALIEEQASGTSVSNTIQYVADINLLVRVRVKGILPFETTSTFGSGGASIGAVRTTDSIVNLP